MTEEQIEVLDIVVKYGIPVVSGILSIAAFIYVHFNTRLLEKYKSQIDKSKFEHNAIYGEVLKKRLDFINYLLVKFNMLTLKLQIIELSAGDNERRQNEITIARDIVNDIVVHIELGKIYLSKDVADSIEHLIDMLTNIVTSHDSQIELEKKIHEDTPNEIKEKTEKLLKDLYLISSENIPLIKEYLEYQFRFILGMEDGKDLSKYKLIFNRKNERSKPSPFSSLFAIFSSKYRR